jgi:hypothetical protein
VRPRQRLATGGSELDQIGGEQFAIEAAHTGYPSTVATISSIASKLLMLHFLRPLREDAASFPEARAPAGMAVPWLLMAMASIAISWAQYLVAPGRSLPDALTPHALWSALWPIAAGTLLAIGLARRRPGLPQIPEGDVSAVALDIAMRKALAVGKRSGQMGAALCRWPPCRSSSLRSSTPPQSLPDPDFALVDAAIYRLVPHRRMMTCEPFLFNVVSVARGDGMLVLFAARPSVRCPSRST